MERKNFITRNSQIADDIDLVERMFCEGYRLTQIVPRFFYGDGTALGYTYWFESLDIIK